MKVVLLNTSIATSYGTLVYAPLALENAQWLTSHRNSAVNSAIGHESTAQIMSDLLKIDVPVNRQQYTQLIGDIAIVLKLNGRLPEGKVLSRAELEEIGFSFGVMIAYNPLRLEWWKPEERPATLQAGWPLLIKSRSHGCEVGFVDDQCEGVRISDLTTPLTWDAIGIEAYALI